MKRKKIKLLTPSETKKIVVDSGSQSGTASGLCVESGVCDNGSAISCSGTFCVSRSETINGKSCLVSVSCEGGGTFFCDNSNVGSGSGSIAKDPVKACKNKNYMSDCTWLDLYERHGRCYFQSTNTLDLICKENAK